MIENSIELRKLVEPVLVKWNVPQFEIYQSCENPPSFTLLTSSKMPQAFESDVMRKLPIPAPVVVFGVMSDSKAEKQKGVPMTKEEYMAFHSKACEKLIAITRAKNSDYTGASGDPFANFAQIGMLVQLPNVVEIGFLTRMSDKISRIGSFVTKGSLQVKDESVEDTLLDLANYCILFAGYLRSQKGVSK